MADKPHIWEMTSANEDVSYFKEMLTHQVSIGTMLSALSIGALVSIPMGLGIGAIPILMAVAGQAIAALFVPSSPVFRKMVDDRNRKDHRDKAREHLKEQKHEFLRATQTGRLTTVCWSDWTAWKSSLRCEAMA